MPIIRNNDMKAVPRQAEKIGLKNLAIHEFFQLGEGTYGFHCDWRDLMTVVDKIANTEGVSIEIASRIGHGVSKTCTILTRGSTIDITVVNESLHMAVFNAVYQYVEASNKLNS